jgi:hypothetical protein
MDSTALLYPILADGRQPWFLLRGTTAHAVGRIPKLGLFSNYPIELEISRRTRFSPSVSNYPTEFEISRSALAPGFLHVQARKVN